MAEQRILTYQEISSDCILLLDDDVRLGENAAENLVQTLSEQEADCVGADTFRNQDMSWVQKMKALLLGGVYPSWNDNYAFRVLSTGAFSYNNHPQSTFYLSDSCAGPAAMWKRETFLKLHLEDELWLDDLGFSYGEDLVQFYKLVINGYKLGIHYGIDIEHMDGKTSSARYKQQSNRLQLRTKAQFIIWWRCFWQTDRFAKGAMLLRFSLKMTYQFLLILLATPFLRRWDFPAQVIKGLREGWQFVHSPEFVVLRPYQFKKPS